MLAMPFMLLANGWTVLSQTQDEVVVEFKLPEYELVNANIRGDTWQRIASDYGSVHAIEGYPELKVYSEAVAIPVDGDISWRILNTSSATIQNVNLKPVFKMVAQDYEVDYVFYQDPRAYNNPDPYPMDIVQKGEPAFIGDRRFISLQIFPFQYLAARKELKVNTDIRVAISINGTKAQPKNWIGSENPVDLVADSFFLNNTTSWNWRLEKTRDTSYQAPKNGTTLVNEIQFIVNQDGIYKIGYDYLNDFISVMTDSLGVDMLWDMNTVDPRYLELRDENGTVPIHFIGESDGHFNQDDFFEFYGKRHAGDDGYMDDYTDENVYTLGLKSSFGARMAVENGGLIVSNPSQYILPDAYEYTTHFEQQDVSDKLGRGWSSIDPEFEREDVWFWKKISAPNLEIIPIDLQYPKDSTIRTASAKVCLHGLTYSDAVLPGQYDHEATVRLNQAMINSHTWVGQTEKIFINQNPIPNSFLMHGTNNMYISLSGNTVSANWEQILLDYADITYWREYKTSQDEILFTKPSNRPGGLYQFQVEGFSSGQVSVYKIGSSIFSNMQIESFNAEGLAPWTVTMQDSVASTEVKYYAVTESMKKIPKYSRLNLPSDLKNPNNQADVVIITRQDFMQAEGTQMMVSLYEQSGYSVEVIDYQDIFDEFESGIRSAEAIKNFLTYAYNNWSSPQLKHVLLLAEGTDDERDFSPANQYALIPVKKLWTYKHGATASDNWYACIVGNDTVPDIVVARLGVWKAEQIMDYAEKMSNYYNQPRTNQLWNSHLTFTSGGKLTDSDDVFAQQSERIKRRNIPSEYRVTRVYTATRTVDAEYRGFTPALKDAFNNGTQFVQFMGHGGGRIWADYNLFNFSDVSTLNNQVYPVVLSLACYASAFDTNGSASISEALVLQPGKGAIVSLGFSGLGYLDQDEDWGHAICEALFKHNFPSVGEATQFALARFYTTTSTTAARYALTNGSAYLGDPLVKLNKPQLGVDVSAQNHVLAPGDTLRVTASFPDGVTAARLFIQKNNEITINIPFDLPVIDGTYNATYVVPATSQTNYTRNIRVTGYSPTTEYVGLSGFGVGRPVVVHQSTFPAQPTWRDSVAFTAKPFANSEIISLTCRVRTDSVGVDVTWHNLPMVPADARSGTYITTAKAPPRETGQEVYYKYVLNTSEGLYESPLQSLVFAGPDLFVQDVQPDVTNGNVRLKVLISNIGNAASTTTDLRLYVTNSAGQQHLHVTQDLLPLDVNASRWEYIPLDNLANDNLTFEVRVNWSNTFPEWHLYYNTNNMFTMTMPFNYYAVGNGGAIMGSVDDNLLVEVPADVVPPGQTSLFYVNALGVLEANNQPGISAIMLLSSDGSDDDRYSTAYDIRTLDPSIVDSTGVLHGNRRLKLTFFYSVLDQPTQDYEQENAYKIYRWNAEGRKWILQGGNLSATENKVIFEVPRTGIYTIYRYTDRIRPSIDVNVQDQEFTLGGYISGKGVISLMLSDANGIDVFDNSIRLYLDGTQIPENEYVASVNLDNVNRIPIKYQLDLTRGNYTLVVDCKDVNGNFNTREIQFTVNETFDVKNIGNYPNPVLGRAEDPKNDGRTRFTYVLTDDADEVTIKVYTVSGRLVKTFSNLPVGVGYHEYPRTLYGWDCKDEAGYGLANGVYFYKVIARKGNKKIEKTMKMAVLK
jgi:hypothetical protein